MWAPKLAADRIQFECRSRLLSVLPPDASRMITVGGVPDLADAHLMSPSAEPEDTAAPKMKRRKSTKGWDGEDLAASSRIVEPYDDSGA